jgi:hypothetical protein
MGEWSPAASLPLEQPLYESVNARKKTFDDDRNPEGSEQLKQPIDGTESTTSQPILGIHFCSSLL